MDKTHNKKCNWENTTPEQCEYRDTHYYCPHEAHKCNCAEVEPKVFIAVPTMGHIKTELVSCLIHWRMSLKGVIHATCGVSPVDHARNEIVRKFLTTNCTHLFMVDADTIPPNDAIQKLLDLDKPVASGLTHIYRDGSVIPNCFINCKTGAEVSTMEAVIQDTGVREIERCGGSCVLIKREVLEKLGGKWFQNIWNEDYTGYTSEDLSFCDKVRAAGFTIWADTSIMCQHSKEILL